MIFGSCRLLDQKSEKPTAFEIIVPVIMNLFRRMIDLRLITPKVSLLLELKQLLLSHINLKMQIP